MPWFWVSLGLYVVCGAAVALIRGREEGSKQ